MNQFVACYCGMYRDIVTFSISYVSCSHSFIWLCVSSDDAVGVGLSSVWWRRCRETKLSSLAIGATVTDLDFVFALCGWICGSALCCVLPAMITYGLQSCHWISEDPQRELTRVLSYTDFGNTCRYNEHMKFYHCVPLWFWIMERANLFITAILIHNTYLIT